MRVPQQFPLANGFLKDTRRISFFLWKNEEFSRLSFVPKTFVCGTVYPPLFDPPIFKENRNCLGTRAQANKASGMGDAGTGDVWRGSASSVAMDVLPRRHARPREAIGLVDAPSPHNFGSGQRCARPVRSENSRKPSV